VTWTLSRHQAPERIERAKALRAEHRLEEARAILRDIYEGGSTDERAMALSLLARVDLDERNFQSAIARFREGVEAHRQRGALSAEARDGFALVHTLVTRTHALADARQVMRAIEPAACAYPEGIAAYAYFLAFISRASADYRALLRELRAAKEGAARAAMPILERDAEMMLALAFGDIGRERDGLDALRAMASRYDDAPACEQYRYADARGWFALEIEDPAVRQEGLDWVARAIAIAAKCPDPRALANTRVNSAYGHLLTGDIAAATAALADLRLAGGDRSLKTAIYAAEIEGRIALARGRAKDALRAFETADDLANTSVLPAEQHRAAVARGEALVTLGRTAEAVEAFERAERILDGGSAIIPLGEGRGRWLGARDQSAQRLVSTLLSRGDVRIAIDAARRARTRTLRNLAARQRIDDLADGQRAAFEHAVSTYRRARAELDGDSELDWKRSASELARIRNARSAKEAELRTALDAAYAIVQDSPSSEAKLQDLAPSSPGELSLLLFPLPDELIVFGVGGGEPRVHRVRSPRLDDPARLGASIFAGALADEIEHSTAVHVMAHGPLRSIDVHALPFRGAPLISRVPVDYPLDVGGMMPPPAPGGGALFVFDPSGNLEGARREMAELEKIRFPPDLRVTFLHGDGATSAAVRQGIAGARVLHYAGHGHFAGEDGLESALPLAAGGHLQVGDILTLASPPELVVLSACEGARESTDARAQALGLAHAFVLAGSEAVVATTRPVNDDLARAVSIRLHGHLWSGQSGKGANAAVALRNALLSVQRELPHADWAAFRVLVR
jgi:tetratricopeptide (TPR) repeat protein